MHPSDIPVNYHNLNQFEELIDHYKHNQSTKCDSVMDSPPSPAKKPLRMDNM